MKIYGTVPVEDMEMVAISVPCLDLTPEELSVLPVSFEDGRLDVHENEPEITSYL